MILILSAKDSNSNSPIEPRFGRCSYLLKVDVEKEVWEAFPNPGNGQSGGAGVAAAQFAIDHKAEGVISGDFGPNAYRALHSAQIPMYLYSKDIKTVSQAFEQFKQGNLTKFEIKD